MFSIDNFMNYIELYCKLSEYADNFKKNRSQIRLLRRAKSLASDLFEDTCGYIVLLFFIIVSITITECAIIITRAIAGEIPSVLEYGMYLGDASLLLKYTINTYRAL